MSDPTSNTRRQLVAASTLGVGVLLALALLLIANYFGWKYHDRFDWTGTDIYSLSEKSEAVLGTLDRDIEAVVFLSPADELYDPAVELLSRYEAASTRFSVRTLDPEKNPAEAQSLVDRYQVSQLNLVVFDATSDQRLVESDDMAEYDYSGMQYGQGPKLVSFKGEEMFTGAILELAEDTKRRILFTKGHGEKPLTDSSAAGLSMAGELLARDNFEVEEWNSLGQSSVPDGTDLLVIAGPTRGFVEPEVAVIRDYLDRGGRVLALVDPVLTDAGALAGTGLEDFMIDHGIELGYDLVVDPDNTLPFYGDESFFISNYGTHPVTRTLSETDLPVILPLVRSVGLASGGSGDNPRAVELLRTSAEGWGETNLADLGGIDLDENDLAGPVSLGVALELATTTALAAPPASETAEEGTEPSAPDSSGRLIVFGDSDFATNASLPNAGNVELLSNSMNWLVARDTLLGIAPKSPEQVRLSLTQGQLRWVNWLTLAILPGLSILLGLGVYMRRRR